jgi:hypothetical protein
MEPTETGLAVGWTSLMVLLLVVLAACSSSAKDEVSVSTPPSLVAPLASTTTSSAATKTTTASTVPVTSATVAKTNTPNSSSTTALPPAKADVEAKVRALYNDAQKAVLACLENPSACDRGGVLSRFVDPARSDYDTLISDRIAGGIRTRSPGPAKDYFVVEEVIVNDDLSGAAVTACIYDGRVQYKPGAAGGAEQIVNDAVSSYHQIWDFERDTDGQLRVDAVSTMDKDPNGNFVYKDVNVCAPPT